jgi:hypothetical protein
MGNCAKKCNICLEYKLVNYKKCICCTNCLVCNECYSKMNEDQKLICPLCRQQKWLKIKKNKIKPEDKFIDITIGDLENPIEEGDIEKFDILLCCSIIYQIGKLLCCLFVLWIIGFLILICLFSYPYEKTKEDSIFILLSLIIGIISFLLSWCCCCPSVNLLGAILAN